MANQKVSERTAILGSAVDAAADVLPIVDTSATTAGSKKILVSQFFAIPSQTLVTPVLGVATATSINKVALTAPATGSTLTIADGKTLTASNTLTFAGADGSTLNIGTGGTLGSAAYTASGAYQAADAELAALAELTSAADRLPYFTGSGTAALATFTAAGRALLDDADASAQRTTLGLGTAATAATGDFDAAGAAAVAQAVSQPVDAELTALAGLTSAADKVPYFTGSGTASVADFTATGRSVVAAASAAAATALFDAMVGDSGAGGTKGMVPAPAAGDAAANKFLKANGTWTAVSGTVAVGDITGLGTGVATALAVNVGSAGAFVTFNGALGTPSSGTLTNATGLPAAGVVGTAAILGANTYTDKQTIALGSLTADKQGLAITATWTNAATYTGAIFVNVTNTSSNAASLLFDLQVGGTSWLKQNAATGQLTINGVVSAYSSGANVSYFAGSASTTGIGFAAANTCSIIAQGFESLRVAAAYGPITRSDMGYGFASSTSYGATDTALGRNAAGVVEINNGTAGTYRDLKLRNVVGQTGYSEMVEMTAPGAGAANTARIYAVDNGAGKTQLMCIFASGAAQQLAIEP